MKLPLMAAVTAAALIDTTPLSPLSPATMLGIDMTRVVIVDGNPCAICTSREADLGGWEHKFEENSETSCDTPVEQQINPQCRRCGSIGNCHELWSPDTCGLTDEYGELHPQCAQFEELGVAVAEVRSLLAREDFGVLRQRLELLTTVEWNPERRTLQAVTTCGAVHWQVTLSAASAYQLERNYHAG